MFQYVVPAGSVHMQGLHLSSRKKAPESLALGLKRKPFFWRCKNRWTKRSGVGNLFAPYFFSFDIHSVLPTSSPFTNPLKSLCTMALPILLLLLLLHLRLHSDRCHKISRPIPPSIPKLDPLHFESLIYQTTAATPPSDPTQRSSCAHLLNPKTFQKKKRSKRNLASRSPRRRRWWWS